MMNDRADAVAVEHQMLADAGEVLGWPAVDPGADPAGAQHRHADPKRKIAAFVQPGRILVVVAGDASGRPFDEPVVADDRRMRQLAADMDRELAQWPGLIADPIHMRV